MLSVGQQRWLLCDPCGCCIPMKLSWALSLSCHLDFLTYAFEILHLLQASGKNLNLNDESQHGLLMQLLKLTHNCLNFDFIGTSTDESSDDLCTVQIPTSWRSGNPAGGRGLDGGVPAGGLADLRKPFCTCAGAHSARHRGQFKKQSII